MMVGGDKVRLNKKLSFCLVLDLNWCNDGSCKTCFSVKALLSSVITAWVILNFFVISTGRYSFFTLSVQACIAKKWTVKHYKVFPLLSFLPLWFSLICQTIVAAEWSATEADTWFCFPHLFLCIQQVDDTWWYTAAPSHRTLTVNTL